MKSIAFVYWMSHECGQVAYESNMDYLLEGDAGHVRAPLDLENIINNENSHDPIFLQQGVMETIAVERSVGCMWLLRIQIKLKAFIVVMHFNDKSFNANNQ